MVYDEGLAERVRAVLEATHGIVEKRMFGGVAWMWRGHMLVGVLQDDLIARVGAAQEADARAQAGTRPFDITHRPMKGFLMVEPEALAEDDALRAWIDRCKRFVGTLPAKA